jgi:hypothetical protein
MVENAPTSLGDKPRKGVPAYGMGGLLLSPAPEGNGCRPSTPGHIDLEGRR